MRLTPKKICVAITVVVLTSFCYSWVQQNYVSIGLAARGHRQLDGIAEQVDIPEGLKFIRNGSPKQESGPLGSGPNNASANKSSTTESPMTTSDEIKKPSNNDHLKWEDGPGKRHRPPKALILGAPKCGTATLETFLTLNPDIVKPRGQDTELTFFNTNKFYKPGLAAYIQKIPAHYEHQIGMERSAHYMYYLPETPLRIKQVNSSMRLIISLCEPTNRLVSKYAQLISWGSDRGRSFGDLFFQNIKGSDSIKSDDEDVMKGVYFVWIQQWLHHFPREQFYFVDGDLFKTDPVPILQDIERFLGLESKITAQNLVLDVDKGFYCMIKDGNKECMNPKKGRAHPDVDRRYMALVDQHYKPNSDKLEKITGQKFSFVNKTRSYTAPPTQASIVSKAPPVPPRPQQGKVSPAPVRPPLRKVSHDNAKKKHIPKRH